MARHPELPERDRKILGALVQAYIDNGEPISSLWLASRGFGVSSATLRNVMARLEELGFVRQPHTSAGRVPTDLGYRSYVDQLLAERRASRPAPDVEERLRRAGTVEDVLSHASQEISRAAHQVGFAMVPATEATLEHLDFVLLWTLGGMWQPVGMVRLMACRDTPTLRRSLFMIGLYYALIYVPLVVTFVCARALYPTQYLNQS